MPTASSQPSADPAGETDALSKAFEAALGSTDMDEAAFAEPAMAPAKSTEPVERKAKPATEDDSGADEEAKAGKAEPEGTAEPALAPPANWDAQRREAFGKMNAAGQKAMLDMAKGLEADFTKRTTEHAEERKLAAGIKSLITDEHRRQMRESGMDEVGGVGYLLKLNDYARTNPREYARWFVQQARIDPRQLFPEAFAGTAQPQPQGSPQGQPQAQRPADPTPQFYSALNPLIETVQGIRQELQQSKVKSADRAIANFRDAKGQDGTALHPHLTVVEREMTQHLSSPALQQIEDFGERLQRAYDIAVANNSDLRTQTLESEVQKRLAKAQADERQKAELAKARKAKAPVRSQPTGPVTAKKTSLDDTLRQVMSESGV